MMDGLRFFFFPPSFFLSFFLSRFFYFSAFSSLGSHVSCNTIILTLYYTLLNLPTGSFCFASLFAPPVPPLIYNMYRVVVIYFARFIPKSERMGGGGGWRSNENRFLPWPCAHVQSIRSRQTLWFNRGSVCRWVILAPVIIRHFEFSKLIPNYLVFHFFRYPFVMTRAKFGIAEKRLVLKSDCRHVVVLVRVKL